MIHPSLEKVLNDAFKDAQGRHHYYLTIEHLLYAYLNSEDGCDILDGAGVSLDELTTDLEGHLATLDFDESAKGVIPEQTLAFQRILKKSLVHVHTAQKPEVDIGDVLIAIFDEHESFALYFLQKQGVTRLDVLNYISHGDFDFDEDDIEAMLPGFMDENEEGEDEEFSRDSRQSKVLDKYADDMLALANEGKYDDLIGRQDEQERTIEILSRRLKNNPIHVGDPGVGKTAITLGFAKRIASGDVPEKLKGFKMYSLNLGALLAGTRYRGDFEERIQKVLKELSALDKVIVYIDEIHTLVGAGGVNGGAMDAANLLKPSLSAGDIRFIGSTTHEEYKKYFEKDRALSRRFQKIDIAEPSEGETIEVLQGLINKFESYHNVSYTKDAIIAAVKLSTRYISEKFLPDKAIDVIDEAGANISIYKQGKKIVRVSDIEKQVAKIAKVPVSAISGSEKTDLLALEEKLNNKVFHQKQAIQKITFAIKRHRSGLGNADKPVGSFLFVGATGVGKTELSKTLAKELAVPLIRFDMSEFMEKHSIAKLLGSPPGYVGYEEGAQLSDQIRKHPHCVLLLDEIEKAHPDILNALLQVMDYAKITDNTGRVADFRNVVLIMTSNAGSREAENMMIGFSESGKVHFQDQTKELKKIFTPEFRNRLDDIIYFGKLDRPTIKKVAQKFVNQVIEQLAEKNIILSIDESIYEYLAKFGYDEKMGARPMYRLVQSKIKNPLVDKILSLEGEEKKKHRIRISFKDSKSIESPILIKQ